MSALQLATRGSRISTSEVIPNICFSLWSAIGQRRGNGPEDICGSRGSLLRPGSVLESDSVSLLPPGDWTVHVPVLTSTPDTAKAGM